MSVKIMSAVFESETLGPTERLIMLSLADHADDAGRCYPSIARLCQRTGLTERTVQTNIRKLQQRGFVRIIPNSGQNGSNVYIISDTPAADAPPAGNAPRMKCATPPHMTAKTPAADAPKPSGTITEPSIPEANASGRCAPTEAENAEFWKNAREYLSRKKVSQKSVGSFIGKVLREHGYDRAVEAFRRCQREGVAEPIPWITAALTRPAHQLAITDNVIRIAMEAVERRDQMRAAR